MTIETWQSKHRHGAQRLACMTCGMHTLILAGAQHRCPGCGGTEIAAVAAVDALRCGRRDAVAASA
jgi:predicted RNA-binding Zn-ribbon protein involved in translation (DUF1610 family)